ncbi:MAG TPA: helix-turn-helix domain-containing protein [Urbifossiella sp.]|nr:helix-turn-helix domain-containing protein [Urbifossiella sp.]
METADGSELLADGTMGVAGAVKFTGLSKPELYRLMAAGRLAFVRHGTRRLIPRKALVTMLAAGLVPATAAVGTS